MNQIKVIQWDKKKDLDYKNILKVELKEFGNFLNMKKEVVWKRSRKMPSFMTWTNGDASPEKEK